MVVITCDAGTHSINEPIVKVRALSKLTLRCKVPHALVLQLGMLVPGGSCSKHVYISCNEPVACAHASAAPVEA